MVIKNRIGLLHTTKALLRVWMANKPFWNKQKQLAKSIFA